MKTYRAVELFSGIGGFHCACRRLSSKASCSIDVVCAVDINSVANDVYRHNFPDCDIISCNIEHIPTKVWDKYRPIDLLMMSPPCQPFTRLGHGKGHNDARCNGLLNVLQLLARDVIEPSFVLIENVKGFEESQVHQEMADILSSKGYDLMEFLLHPYDVGVPNARLRYFGLASKFGFEKKPLISGIITSVNCSDSLTCLGMMFQMLRFVYSFTVTQWAAFHFL